MDGLTDMEVFTTLNVSHHKSDAVTMDTQKGTEAFFMYGNIFDQIVLRIHRIPYLCEQLLGPRGHGHEICESSCFTVVHALPDIDRERTGKFGGNHRTTNMS